MADIRIPSIRSFNTILPTRRSIYFNRPGGTLCTPGNLHIMTEDIPHIDVLNELNKVIAAREDLSQENLNWIVQQLKKQHYRGAE